MTMGVIDCSTEDYEEVVSSFSQWLATCEHHSYINNNAVNIVKSSYENYYGGVKLGFFVDIKHDYYGMVFKSLIHDFESLMNALPFNNALLFHSGSGNLIEWFVTDSEMFRAIQSSGDFIEQTSFPGISRVTRGDCMMMESFKLKTIDR